jgi:hypothetical protein
MRALDQLIVLLLVLFLSIPVLLDDYDEDSEPEYDTKADYVSHYLNLLIISTIVQFLPTSYSIRKSKTFLFIALKGQCHEKSVSKSILADALELRYEPLTFFKIFLIVCFQATIFHINVRSK